MTLNLCMPEIRNCRKDVCSPNRAGTLGYEVHGKIEDAHIVYNKLLELVKNTGLPPWQIGLCGIATEGSILSCRTLRYTY